MISILLIGDELLSGQVEDENLKYMLRQFGLTGHTVSEIRYVKDDIAEISQAFRDLSQKYSYLISSGGVGPTHDDCTINSVAEAFNEKLYRHPILEQSLRQFYKDKITDAALSMANIPESAELLDEEGHNWPIVKVRNCFVLPGVPSIFKQKFDRLFKYLPEVKSFYCARIYVNSDEAFFAEKLIELNQKYHDIIIGSYPIFGEKSYNVQITLRHSEKDYLNILHKELELFFRQTGTLVASEAAKIFKPK